MDKLKVMIIDDQSLFRAGIRQVLSSYPGFDILECAPSAETLSTIETATPDVVLLGCRLTVHSSMELAERIARYLPNSRVIMLSPDPDDQELFDVIKTSAAACLNKNASGDELVSTIKRASTGEYPINEAVMTRPTVASRVLRQFEEVFSQTDETTDSLMTPLTARETEILRHVADGNTNRQIAALLDISEQTIKNHVSAILRKLNANDRAHAVTLAIRSGWISLKAEVAGNKRAEFERQDIGNGHALRAPVPDVVRPQTAR